jgi:polar amino acid transport system substrate-binding protein
LSSIVWRLIRNSELSENRKLCIISNPEKGCSMRFGIFLALLIVLFSVNHALCYENAPILKDRSFIMAFIRPETQYLGKWQRLIYTEVFKRLGIKTEFRDYPPKRSSIEADAGNVDGEAGRPYEYLSEHPDLVRVEEFLNINFSAFIVKDSIPQLDGWGSLRGTDYRVEYLLGVKKPEYNLSKVVKKENLSAVAEQVQGLKKLVAGRTDLFVDEETGVLTLLNTPEFKNSKIRIAGVMEAATTYPYLHKKHAALALKMAEIIKAMKAEGLIEQYRMAVDKEFGIVRK